MPVDGLPPILENALNSCLQEKCITGWKIEGIAYNIQVYMSFDEKPNGKDIPCQNWIKDLDKVQDDLSNLAGKRLHRSISKESFCMESTQWKIEGLGTNLLKPKDSNHVKINIDAPKQKSPMHNEKPPIIGLEVNENDREAKDKSNFEHLENDCVEKKDNSSVSNHDIVSITSNISTGADVHQSEEKNTISEEIDVNLQEKDSSIINNISSVELPKEDNLNQVRTVSSPSHFNESTGIHLNDKHWNSISNCGSIKSSAENSPTFHHKKSFLFHRNHDASPHKTETIDSHTNKDSTKILSKVIKVLKRSATHCSECQKVIKQTTKSKCTVCDVFICSDCIYNSIHMPEHKRFISMFSYPTVASDKYCRACGYVTRIKHSYNTNFTCEICPEYLLCQGCMSQGMHGHHEDYLKPIL